uniref:uncharacterized protein LOC131108792 n=1 Tax=Doryrhamphus excisus TaxID=161450 RepID=UPI0025AEA0A9|nr:uncharacterized protein LOC131108792 [Doryrhamphus excisus]XP_057916098.1 uncharacterized protein LOC131108792 [Doryrhamphus excisus]
MEEIIRPANQEKSENAALLTQQGHQQQEPAEVCQASQLSGLKGAPANGGDDTPPKAAPDAPAGESVPEMEKKLKEKEEEVTFLVNALADAEMVTALVNKSWKEAYQQLKKSWEDDSHDLVAAVNAEWQQWWAFREQETADQFQTQRENMQWRMDDMAAQFQMEMEGMQRHSLDIIAYFRITMERLHRRVRRLVREKNRLVAKLQNENCCRVAENGETSHDMNAPQDAGMAFVEVVRGAEEDLNHRPAS